MGTEYVAVLTGSFLTGAMMNLHLLTIPILIETTQQPAQLVHQWSRIFYSGHRKGPGIAFVTGALYGYAAWAKHSVGEPWHHWMVAAVTTVSMVPYTWMFMNATNTALFHAEDQFEKGGVEISLLESVRLVKKWDWLNTVRALFPLAGSVMGMLGVCGMMRHRTRSDSSLSPTSQEHRGRLRAQRRHRYAGALDTSRRRRQSDDRGATGLQLGNRCPDSRPNLREEHGVTHLDVVVANAAMATNFGPASTMPLEHLQAHMMVNMYAPVLLFQATRLMLQQSKQQAKFILIGAPISTITNMHDYARAPLTAYGVSKLAANYMVRKFHFENKWLTAFIIDPGHVQTDMGDQGARLMGRPQAPTTVADSVAGICARIDEATKETTSGHFVIHTDGSQLSW
ncbi:hypothetical protein ANOM_008218 [Aspergillus nomiae NRRL 13137]|uniref:Noranthrone monooxygenase n=1 Tax=Aspergillus nomiae NRRL (strain ATCC 15546 / NRRL 13137 / CBS 260.88 / M93) TaxID=1509407 RepID=A0A0L1IW99_ASPN3|nr:uncharacterized protein ANOM_008218 [Aspergillus nomiae NRRL 13137]KNG83779.1 hypothetical protein ANOM_008218 [Aspergillus nomiae NRRL 13137]